MKKNVIRKKDALLKYKWQAQIKKCGLYLMVFLCIGIIWVPLAKTFADNLLGTVAQIFHYHAWEMTLSAQATYIILWGIGLSFTIWLCRKIFPNYPDRNAQYLKKMLKSDSKNLPAVSREDLLKKVIGDKRIDPKYKQMVTGYIDQNITPIKNFLKSNTENVLVIKSKWGTGKTTSLLIAIDEFDYDNSCGYKYIYESAFKYSNGISEYLHDILESIRQILISYNINIEFESKNLLKNLDSNLPKTILNTVSMRKETAILSSDIISKINNKVAKKATDTKIVVILDDLDRLDKNEIVKAISFLSLLRRMRFIKVILPIDSNAIISQLKDTVYEPKQFIQKYLPDQTALQFKTDYEMIENIALVTVKEKMGLKDEYLDLCQPVWEATLLLMISEKIRGELSPNRNYNFKWLTSSRIKQDENNLEWLHGTVLTILNAPYYASRHADNVFSNQTGINEYNWDTTSTNIRQFQHIIWALKRRKERSYTHIRDSFTEYDYEKTVASWIRNYAKDNWKLLGFSLRDVINTINGREKIKAATTKGEIFVNTFNKYFPQSPIKYSAADKENENSNSM